MVYENEEYIEKFILVAVDLVKEDVDDSLDELEELTNTCGGEVVCRVIQPRESIHPGTYIGKGKIEELKEMTDGVVWSGPYTDEMRSIYFYTKLGFVERRIKENSKFNQSSYIVVDGPNEIFLPAEGGSGQIVVKSNTDWTIKTHDNPVD